MVFKMRRFSLPTEEDLQAIGGQVRRYSLRQLQIATDNFSNIIGRGGYSDVYKGHLPDGSVVAVKRLRARTNQAEKEFRAEMFVASLTAEHPNLLRLRGFCITKKERLLVYPSIPNGDLASRLFPSESDYIHLDWPTRKRVALGLAKGLACLHQKLFVHLDVKPSNILLGHDFEPILSDFGLSRPLGKNHKSNSNWENEYPFVNQEEEEEEEDDDSEEPSSPCHAAAGGCGRLTKCWNLTKTMVKSGSNIAEGVVGEEDRTCTWSCWQCSKNEVVSSSNNTCGITEFLAMTGQEPISFTCYKTNGSICGTIQYMPPEFMMRGIYSLKNDVYGYGITLLQLITRKEMLNDMSIVRSTPCTKPMRIERLKDNQLFSLVDPSVIWDIHSRATKMEVEQLIRVAQLCIQIPPMLRPKMSEVVQMVQGIISGSDPYACYAFDRARIFPSPLIHDSRFEPQATGWATFDGCVLVASDPSNWVQFESTHHQIEPEPLLEEIIEPVTSNDQHDYQGQPVNIISGDGLLLPFKFNKLSGLCVIILLTSFCMNLVSVWFWASPHY